MRYDVVLFDKNDKRIGMLETFSTLLDAERFILGNFREDNVKIIHNENAFKEEKNKESE